MDSTGFGLKDLEYLVNGEYASGSSSTSSPLGVLNRPLNQIDANVRLLANLLAVQHKSDGNLKDLSVAASMLKDGAVSSAKIASNAVTSVKIQDGAVSSAKIASNAVTANKIADGAVTTNKVPNNNITEAKLASIPLASSKFTGNLSVSRITGAATAPKIYKTSAGTWKETTLNNGETLLEGYNFNSQLNSQGNSTIPYPKNIMRILTIQGTYWGNIGSNVKSITTGVIADSFVIFGEPNEHFGWYIAVILK